MSDMSFDTSCDRLSQIVDNALYERLQWERNIGPKLVRLVELAHAAIKDRSEFEWAEEGATSNVKRFVLKIHANRIFAITLQVADGRAVVDAEAIDRSRLRLLPGAPISADFAEVDEAWMTAALEQMFARVHP